MRTKIIRFTILTGVCFSLPILSFNCDWPDEPTGPSDVYKVFMFCTLIKNTVREYQYEDMMDGTTKLTVTTGYERNCYRETVTSVIYIKKCLQGQTYQPGPNNCQGTGGAPDWGAQKFQFCPTNDRSCEDSNYKADPLTSPAAFACASDTTAGRTWRLIPDNPRPFNSEAITFFPEMVTGATDYIWSEDSHSSNQTMAWVYRLDISGNVFGTALLKNSTNYVLCMAE